MLKKFGIKNVKYAIPDATGSYVAATIKSLGGANSLALESQYSSKDVFADGKVLMVLASDKGLNGKLSMVHIEDDYEIAMKRKMLIDGGVADVEQLGTVPHALYFECDADDGSKKITVKNWLFNVISGKPNEQFDQDTESPNPSNYEMNLNILGVNLKTNAGTADYTDTNGNTLKVWRLSSVPTDANYATFGASVPTPKAVA